MTSVDAATGVATQYSSVQMGTGTATDKTALGNQDFLNLLVKQMQYQDPSSPMDSTQFTQQLVAIKHWISTYEQARTIWMERGTASNTSRDTDAMYGSTMIARMIPAASMLGPYAGPEKSPVLSRCRVSRRKGITGSRSTGRSTKIPHSP